MRKLLALLLAIATLSAGCSAGSDDPDPRPALSKGETISLASLGLDWPRATGTLTPPKRPATPAGFDDVDLDEMAKVLTKWATVAALDDAVWQDNDPRPAVAATLPKAAGSTLRKQVKDAVSPHLAVANVFADDVSIIGKPLVTSAWKVSKDKDGKGKSYILLELQTRTAYEVRSGDGPTRVIGVLRVHGLSAYADTTDDFGVGGGWQEYGAGDCALALDDELRPESDGADALKDLKTFTRIGDGSKLEMPELGVQEQVDDEYLKRCREGQV
ncbi:hypothetical protein [Aeromicrobium sp.]|uniref:hypothetical protein n=1 Tax=Aeromicrobium sp. TaxID=1871063 RepID=UPI0030C0EAB6